MRLQTLRKKMGMVAAAATLVVCTPNWAASAASGSAYGLSTNLSATALVGGAVTTLSLGPSPTVSGTAPPDFNQSQTLASITGTLLVGASTAAGVGSGTLAVTTQSSLIGNTTTSTASVENLNVSLSSSVPVTVLGLQAQAVTSTASATCNAGSVALSGSTNLTGVVLDGVLIGLTVGASPAANTVLLNALGVTVILNEQIVSGNQITVNAIHITLNNALLAGLGTVSGDLVVSQSVAAMADCALPDLVMGKSGPTTATVGVPFNYALTVSNAGTVPTSGTITVTDTVPAGLSINSVANGANFACGTVAQTVTCTSTTVIGAGASSVLVATINVTAAAPGSVSNTAVVSGGGDNTPNNNTSTQVDSTVNAAATPDLAMSKSGPGTATVGTPFSYVLTLANVGTGASAGTITVSDVVAAGLTINSVTNGANFTCGTIAQTVTCTSSSVIGASAANIAVATINVTPTAAGSVVNSATVSGGGDNTPGNNTSQTVDTTVNAVATPDLAMSKSGPGTATVGTAFDYVLTLANVGTGATAGSITVSDIVPAGLTINSVTNGANFTCGTAAQTITCTSSTTIAAGAANVAVATVNVTPTAVGSVGNTAVVSGGGDNTPANNSSTTVNTTVNATATPDLAMSKAGPATGTVGVAFNYALSLANVGTGPTAGTITVSDTVPAGLTVNNVTDAANFTCGTVAQTVTCTSNTSVAAGASNVPVATINVTPTTASIVGNTAIVSGGGDNTPANNSNTSVNTTVGVASPDLSMGKTGPASASVGTAFNYVLTLSNIGTAATSGLITVTDTIAASLTINSVTNGVNFSCSAIAQTVTCTSSTVIANGASNLTVATINVTPTVAGGVSNTATVVGGTDATPVNNTSPPVDTVVAATLTPDLAMGKTGPGTATIGTPFNYFLALDNIGAGPTAGLITVTDNVPAGITINFVSGSPSFACGFIGQTVTCTSSSVIAAGTLSVAVATINVTPTVGGSFSNTATAAGGGDSTPVNNTSPPVVTQFPDSFEPARPIPTLSPLLLGMLLGLMALAGLYVGKRREWQ